MTIREIIFAPQETKWAIGSDGAHTVCLLVSNKAVLGTALFGNTMSSSGPVFSSLFATYCSRSVPQNLGPPGFSSKRPRVVKRPPIVVKHPRQLFYEIFIAMHIHVIVMQIHAPLTLISTCFLGRTLTTPVTSEEQKTSRYQT